VVIGHSMGKAAMALAPETPGLVGNLVVVDIAPVSYPDRFSTEAVV
jgi:pimeloyl-ACP methyl ester carboxylesterase